MPEQTAPDCHCCRLFPPTPFDVVLYTASYVAECLAISFVICCALLFFFLR
jgi:hypothetical protein